MPFSRRRHLHRRRQPSCPSCHPCPSSFSASGSPCLCRHCSPCFRWSWKPPLPHCSNWPVVIVSWVDSMRRAGVDFPPNSRTPSPPAPRQQAPPSRCKGRKVPRPRQQQQSGAGFGQTSALAQPPAQPYGAKEASSRSKGTSGRKLQCRPEKWQNQRDRSGSRPPPRGASAMPRLRRRRTLRRQRPALARRRPRMRPRRAREGWSRATASRSGPATRCTLR